MRSLRRVPDPRPGERMSHPRAGAVSTLDYVLGLCVVFPLVAFAMPTGKRIIQLSWETICVMISWPFM